MKTINIENIVSMYNDENKSLQEIGENIGKSKSSVLRLFNKHGYKLNKSIGKYENNTLSKTNDNCKQEKNETNVSRETNINCETMVNRTYAISEKIDRAMKIKSA
ncbi:MAG: hypothetical protein Q4Q23_08105, partial [Methanobacteriaceae archaeon]|nr:hypothetical protein [Methanobacteriaceae archaeon]